MKQVSRKFLEEQVKLSLKEIGVQDVGPGSASSKDDNIDLNRVKSVGQAVIPIWNFIKEMAIGSDQSYDDVLQWAKDTESYGLGRSKYIAKALDAVPKMKKGPNAGINQTALRFLDIEPIAELEDDLKSTGLITIKFNNLLPEMSKLANDTTNRILKEKSKKSRGFFDTSLEKSIEEILKRSLYGVEMGIDEQVGSQAGNLNSEFLYIGLDQLATKYALNKSGVLSFDDWPNNANLTKSSSGEIEIYKRASGDNIERYAKQIIKLIKNNSSQKRIKNLVERIITSQFTYLRNTSIQEVKLKILKSDIPAVITAVANFKNFQNTSMKALFGAGDIALSLGSTLAAVMSGGMSLLLTTPGKAMVRKSLSAVVKKHVLEKTLVKSISAINKGKKLGIRAGGTFKANLAAAGIVYGGGALHEMGNFTNSLASLRKSTAKYLKLVKEGKLNKIEEKSTFYDMEISPIIKKIEKKHYESVKEYFQIIGMAPETIDIMLKKEDDGTYAATNQNYFFGNKFKTNFLNHSKSGDDAEQYILETIYQLAQNLKDFSKEAAKQDMTPDKDVSAMKKAAAAVEDIMPKEVEVKIVDPDQEDSIEDQELEAEEAEEAEEREVKSDISQDKRASDKEDLSSDEMLRRLMNKKTVREQNSNSVVIEIPKWSRKDKGNAGNEQGQLVIANLKKAVNHYIGKGNEIIIKELPENLKSDPYYTNIVQKTQDYINSKKPTAAVATTAPDAGYDTDKRKIKRIRRSVGFKDVASLNKPSLAGKLTLGSGGTGSSADQHEIVKSLLDPKEDLYKSFSTAFGLTVSDLYGFNRGLEVRVREIASGSKDLTEFRDNRINYLKNNVHKIKTSRWRKEYKAEISLAGNDPAKIEQIEKKIAFYYRPRYIVFLNVTSLNGTLSDLWEDDKITDISFSFEPNTNRVYVNSTGATSTYKGMSNPTIVNGIIKIISIYAAAAAAAVVRATQISEQEPEQADNMKEFIRFGNSLSTVLNGTLKMLNSSTSPLRKAYAIFSANTIFNAME